MHPLALLPGLIAAAALSSAGPAPAQPTHPRPTLGQPELPARRAELQAELSRDRERLKQMIRLPATPESTPLRVDPELRAIAERMPRLQRELRALEQREPEVEATGHRHEH